MGRLGPKNIVLLLQDYAGLWIPLELIAASKGLLFMSSGREESFSQKDSGSLVAD